MYANKKTAKISEAKTDKSVMIDCGASATLAPIKADKTVAKAHPRGFNAVDLEPCADAC